MSKWINVDDELPITRTRVIVQLEMPATLEVDPEGRKNWRACANGESIPYTAGIRRWMHYTAPVAIRGKS